LCHPVIKAANGVPWLALAAVAAALAIVYAIVPAATNVEGFRWFVLRWFHAIAWVLLGLAAFVRAKVTGAPVEAAAPLAATGGLVYVVFMLTTVAGDPSP
jgi:hypothetical protein